MVSRRPLGLSARSSNNNAAVPARMSSLRRGVSIIRLLPVRPPRLFPSTFLKLMYPLESSQVQFQTVQLPIIQPPAPAQQMMGPGMGTTTMRSVCVMHPPSSRVWLVGHSSSSSHHWGPSHGSACSHRRDIHGGALEGMIILCRDKPRIIPAILK